MTNIFANLQAETEKQQQVVKDQQSPAAPTKTPRKKKSTSKPTRNSTQVRDIMREMPRNTSSDIPRENSRELPTRDEIQEFSFRLRDELKVKVQAEVPHQWQQEFEDIARQLDVKKLELYRFILGEFLGKVSRNSTTHQPTDKKPV